ncbi:hypothetical protein [Thalassovita sp.]|uniref:hypothetical protein n=1 Tax=Thalassovita sp. TaxID=1979401 RepID=UPI0029DE634F|nr:hypothetical protein [Thalassovita sp.]
MFDTVDPIVVPNDGTIQCPGCNVAFKPKRTNQRFCSRECQRRSSRNSSRGSRSNENKERSWQHYERAHRLTEMIHSARPQDRLGTMKHILEFIPRDAGLRNILSDPKLYKQRPRADNRLNITRAANAYTKKFFGLSIKRYINAVCSGQEPEGVYLQDTLQ